MVAVSELRKSREVSRRMSAPKSVFSVTSKRPKGTKSRSEPTVRVMIRTMREEFSFERSMFIEESTES
jgi:hypothetical protein